MRILTHPCHDYYILLRRIMTHPNNNPHLANIERLAECAERLNPPPPVGDGVLRTLVECIIKHTYALRTGPRIPPAAAVKIQKQGPKIASVFCCLSGPILRAFRPEIGAQICPK